MRSPSNQISPRSGDIVPSMRLKSVVLPEPFGPMSAVIDPALDRERDAVDRLDAAEALLGATTSRIGPAGRFRGLLGGTLDDAHRLALEARTDLRWPSSTRGAATKSRARSG